MRNRIIAIFVALTLIAGLSGVVFASDPGEFFNDAQQWDAEFFAEPAYWLGRTGIFIGDEGANLNPNEPLTRAQMATILSRMTGQTAAATSLSSSPTSWTDDDEIPGWARGYMALAEAQGWFIGHQDGSVGPNDNLTFAQIAILLARITGNEDLATGSWPASAMIAATSMDLFEDVGAVDPNSAILRGEMVAVSFRAMLVDTHMNRPAAEGGPEAPLMEQQFPDEYEEYLEVEPTTVTGEWTNYLSSSQRIVVGDETYDLRLSETNNVSVHVILNERTWLYMGFSGVFNYFEDEVVTITLNDDDEVEEIEATLDTYPDEFLEDVATIEDEEDFGTVTVDGDTLEVDDDTEVYLDGTPITLAELEQAFEDFTAEWETNKMLATVRTVGNERADGKDAIWIAAITENTLEGTVTGKGTDTDGEFVRIDDTKYHYLAPVTSSDFTVGENYTVLLDSADDIRLVLDTTPEESEFFGMLKTFEVDSEDVGTAIFELADGSEVEVEYDATSWSIGSSNLDWVWYVVHDGEDLVTFDNPTDATKEVDNEELLSVTETYLRTSDGVDTTTVILGPSVFGWDDAISEHVDPEDLIGRMVDVHVDSEGNAGFVISS
ncbi:MAG: S-layer homology domain-containing protein [Bacillota bacterium]